MGVTLDTGALIAFERRDRRIHRHLRNATARGLVPTVPAVAVAESWRDGRKQTQLRRLLTWTHVEEVTDQLARRSGELMARTRTSNAVDAIVACSAARRGDLVLTSDPRDLERLADDLGTIRVRRI